MNSRDCRSAPGKRLHSWWECWYGELCWMVAVAPQLSPAQQSGLPNTRGEGGDLRNVAKLIRQETVIKTLYISIFSITPMLLRDSPPPSRLPFRPGRRCGTMLDRWGGKHGWLNVVIARLPALHWPPPGQRGKQESLKREQTNKMLPGFLILCQGCQLFRQRQQTNSYEHEPWKVSSMFIDGPLVEKYKERESTFSVPP